MGGRAIDDHKTERTQHREPDRTGELSRHALQRGATGSAYATIAGVAISALFLGVEDGPWQRKGNWD